MNNEKEYFAFISYKREDEKWAKWLQNKLEHYKLPSNLNGRIDLPKEIRPVFRDKSELAGGVLAEEIHKALTNSKFLIVICSPRAAHSQWVDKEVQTFINLGRIDQIIPFIIEGTAHSQTLKDECFPKALLDLTPDQELLGINIDEMGRDAAAVKVVAQMFGLKFDALWQRYEKGQRKKRRLRFCAIMGASFIMMGVAFWMYRQWWRMKENQSRFVAEKALKLIDEGDSYLPRILGINILPNSMSAVVKNRPYTAEAEYLLRKAFSNDETIVEFQDEPFYLEYSPNGDILLVVYEGFACIVDVCTGNCVQKFPIPPAYEFNAAFNSDGSRIVVSVRGEEYLDNYSIYTWERINQSFSCADTLLLSSEEDVSDIEIVKYGKRKDELITSSSDGTMRFYRFDNDCWRCVDTLNGNKSGTKQISINIDGNVLVSGNRDSTIIIWKEMDSVWRCTNTIRKEYSLDEVLINSLGNCIISSSDSTINVYCSTEDGWICVDTLEFSDYINSVSFSPNGSQFVSCGYDSIRVWEIEDRHCHSVKAISSNDEYLPQVAFSPDGNYLALSEFSKKRVRIVSLLDANTCPTCIVDQFQRWYSYSRFFDNGNKLFAGDDFGEFRIYEYNGYYWKEKGYGEKDDRLDWCTGATISRDWMAISWYSGGAIHIYKFDNNKEWSLYSVKKGDAACFSSDGLTMAIANYNEIELWHLEFDEWVLKDSLIGHNSNKGRGVTSLCFSDKDSYLISASYDRTIRIWHEHNHKWLCDDTLSVADSPFGAIFCPGLLQIASFAYNDNDITIWNKEHGRWIPTRLKGHTKSVNSISYSLDGKYLISSSDDFTIRIWEMTQKKCVFVMRCNERPRSASFNEDGTQFVVSYSGDWTKIYNFPPLQDLIDQTQERFKDRPLTPEERHQYYLE